MKYVIILALFLYGVCSYAQEPDKEQITATLQAYINGTSFNQPELIKSAFIDSATLLLERKEQPIWPVAISEYATWFKNNAGEFNGRIGEILAIDVAGNIASAKVEILLPARSVRFVDMFLLKKLGDGWKIISKTAAQESAINTGERILFIVSDAHFHGDTTYPAGVSFSEIVKAFDTFKQAGFTVDFVSPKGGAIPLSYINTSEPLHKKYLYTPDFMYAIGHTLTPEQVNPADYRAVHYVGGSNAMYGVADNKAIQDIAMAVYEEHNGIVSSVCHGTAGIVNLKTKDGQYLVKGKRISGYPEAYEGKRLLELNVFPFFIQETIEKRGGKFFYSERNTPHVEVDGRIVTGQNHLSSPLVAEKMVELLKRG